MIAIQHIQRYINGNKSKYLRFSSNTININYRFQHECHVIAVSKVTSFPFQNDTISDQIPNIEKNLNSLQDVKEVIQSGKSSRIRQRWLAFSWGLGDSYIFKFTGWQRHSVRYLLIWNTLYSNRHSRIWSWSHLENIGSGPSTLAGNPWNRGKAGTSCHVVSCISSKNASEQCFDYTILWTRSLESRSLFLIIRRSSRA